MTKKTIILSILLCLTLGMSAQPFISGYNTVQQSPMYSVVGKQFFDAEGRDVNGKNCKFSDFIGKGNYVLIDFWASWCQPCMNEMPNVLSCYKKYHKKGFDVVGFSLDSRESEWKKAITEKKLSWHHISDLKGFESPASRRYFLEYIPWSILVDGKGKIVEVGLRDQALRDKLKEIYNY